MFVNFLTNIIESFAADKRAARGRWRERCQNNIYIVTHCVPMREVVLLYVLLRVFLSIV